jgi:flagellin-like protein
MRGSRRARAVTSPVGLILLVAITVVLVSVIGVYTFEAADDMRERPTFAALDLSFEEATASSTQYDEFRWEIELTSKGGETVDADKIVVYLDHGNQRVTGTLNRPLRSGETVEVIIVHTTITPESVNCTDTNVACRLAGGEDNRPSDDRIRLRMIHEPSESILYQERIRISGEYGIYNGNAQPQITNETLTFA